MQEYVTVSSSSYDPASLATKLTEKSGEGWTIVAIVPTGGDVTAFLSRDAGAAGSPMMAEAAPMMAEAAPAAMAPEPVAAAPEPVAAEPAGWAVAPEASGPPAYQSASAAPATVIQSASAMSPTDYSQQQQQPAQQYAAAQPAYQPQPVAAAPATPAVPAGWYGDPAGRYELRYWDGSTWTEHVSTGGVQSTNPPVA